MDGNPNYEVYNSTSDIYTYFFELGHKILKEDKGVFSFICSKKYTRANYGQNLRTYLLKKTKITGYVDFNEVQVFGATVDTSIIFFQRLRDIPIEYNFPYCNVGNDIVKNQPLVEYIHRVGYLYPKNFLNENTWSFASLLEEKIKILIQNKGKSLKDWPLKINYGIKTGLNEVFCIDGMHCIRK